MSHAQVLRQALPIGSYDSTVNSLVSADIRAFASVLETAEVAAGALLDAARAVPLELLADYERDLGLPVACAVAVPTTPIARRAAILGALAPVQHYTLQGLQDLCAAWGVTVLAVIRTTPLVCTAPCTDAVDTERNRFRLILRLWWPLNADMSCLIEHYLPAAWRVDIEVV